jgi:DNA-binding response OmpR family regulator
MQADKPVILYVDDDQDFLDGTRFLLEANGYVMIEALSAEAGLKAFKAHAPDLVLVDLMMEEVDAGTGLVRDLRALGSHVPVIMISSAGDNLSLVTDYGDLGLSGVFQKPVDPETLLAILSQRIPRAKG